METQRICPSCRKALADDAPMGLCPECLVKSGFSANEETGSAPSFPPPSVAEIAKLFPQFEIICLIGRGGMGAVYKARQPALDRFIALKILPPMAASDPGFAERFVREARALAKLTHPNIVAVHDFGATGGLNYLVMEFVDGANLREVQRAGHLAPEQALQIVPQICDALQFAHGEGVVHRDIKPENILLDKKGRVKITDFGIAKIIGALPEKIGLTGVKDIIGTPHYMAPEQLERPGSVDHRADIFSLGVVFYEMLTGELPIGKFSPPSSKVRVDVRLDDVVLRALEKEPQRRYQQAIEVKTDVQTITATPPPPVSTLNAPPVIQSTIPNERRGSGRVWVIAGISAAAVICLLIIVPAAVMAYLRASRRAELSRRMHSEAAPFSQEQSSVQKPAAQLNETGAPPPGYETKLPPELATKPTGLRYQWKPATAYGYSVTVEATADDYIEIISGTVNYNVRSVDGDKATLSSMSHLGSPFRRPRPGKTLPMSFPSSFGNFWRTGPYDFSPREIQVDSSGRILSQSGGNSTLPQALGDVERLIFEPLSPSGAKRWEANSDCAITLTKFLPMAPGSSFGREQETILSAHEHATYEVAATTGNTIQIRKRYDLQTQEKLGGQPRAQLTGEGTITFDTALNLPRAMEFQGTFSEATENMTRRTPVKLSYKLLDGAERGASSASATNNIHRTELTASEVRSLLADLQSSSVARRHSALHRLAAAKPIEPRGEVARALTASLNDSDWAAREAAARALGVWGTADAVPPLMTLVGDSQFSVRWAAMDALANLKDSRAIAPVAARLANRTDSMRAVQALKSFGPAAEDSVIEVLQSKDEDARQSACRVLEEIGTAKSLPLLSSIARGADGITTMLARQAISAIEGRK
jgi:serine/threonine protein kinase